MESISRIAILIDTQRSFGRGLCQTLERIPKLSAQYYREVTQNNAVV